MSNLFLIIGSITELLTLCAKENIQWNYKGIVRVNNMWNIETE